MHEVGREYQERLQALRTAAEEAEGKLRESHLTYLASQTNAVGYLARLVQLSESDEEIDHLTILTDLTDEIKVYLGLDDSGSTKP